METTVTWISASDRLPMDFMYVLIAIPGRHSAVAAYISNNRWVICHGAATPRRVTAWAYMPDTPSFIINKPGFVIPAPRPLRRRRVARAMAGGAS